MIVKEPDLTKITEVYHKLIDAKYELKLAQRRLKELEATSMRDAINDGKKTKDIEVAKVLGYTSEQEAEMSGLRASIIELEKKVDIYQAAIDVKLLGVDLYKSNLYYESKIK